MNQGRLKSIVCNLSSASTKVFDVVPLQEAWCIAQIIAELSRKGQNTDHKLVAGCLDGLVKFKLVNEPVRGYFIRAHISKITPEPEISTLEVKDLKMSVVKVKPIAVATVAEAANPVEEEKTPLDLLAGFGPRIGVIIGNLQRLAQDIDGAALLVAEQLEVSEGKNEKLKQLQQLLKSLQ